MFDIAEQAGSGDGGEAQAGDAGEGGAVGEDEFAGRVAAQEVPVGRVEDPVGVAALRAEILVDARGTADRGGADDFAAWAIAGDFPFGAADRGEVGQDGHLAGERIGLGGDGTGEASGGALLDEGDVADVVFLEADAGGLGILGECGASDDDAGDDASRNAADRTGTEHAVELAITIEVGGRRFGDFGAFGGVHGEAVCAFAAGVADAPGPTADGVAEFELWEVVGGDVHIADAEAIARAG